MGPFAVKRFLEMLGSFNVGYLTCGIADRPLQKVNRADQTNRGELANRCARYRATTLYSVGSSWDLDHEAVIRFSGEAPGRRAHSHHGIETMQIRGSSPPRIVIGGRSRKRGGAELCTFVEPAGQAAWRSITPSGTLPVVTKRHSSMSSF